MSNVNKLLKLLKNNGWELEPSEYKIVRNVNFNNNPDALPCFFLRNQKSIEGFSSVSGFCRFKNGKYTGIRGLAFDYPVYIMVLAQKVDMYFTWNDTLCVSLSYDEVQRIQKILEEKQIKKRKNMWEKRKEEQEKLDKSMQDYLKQKYPDYIDNQVDK